MTPGRRGYRITDDADADIRGIASHIAKDSPTASVRVLESVRAAFQTLADEPALGERCGQLGSGLRCFSPRRPAHGYVVYYRRTASNALIEIIGVIHGARDQGEALRGQI